jgi:hypothetical protein
MLNTSAPTASRPPEHNCFNARTLGSLAALVRIVEYFAVAPRSSRTRAPASLILDGLCPPPSASVRLRACALRRDLGETSARLVCACTHYLVFKEPARRPPRSRPGPLEPFSREPCDVTRPGRFCQPLSCRPTSLPEPAPKPISFWGTLRIYQNGCPVSTPFSRQRELSAGPPQDLLQAETRNAPIVPEHRATVVTVGHVRGRRTIYPRRPEKSTAGANPGFRLRASGFRPCHPRHARGGPAPRAGSAGPSAARTAGRRSPGRASPGPARR